MKQIISGKGKQIILGAEIGFLAGMRGWPHWLAQTFVHLGDRKADLAQMGAERTGG